MDKYDSEEQWSDHFSAAIIALSGKMQPSLIGAAAKEIADGALAARLEHDAEVSARIQETHRPVILQTVHRAPSSGLPLVDLRTKVKDELKCAFEPRIFHEALFYLIEKQDVGVEVGADGVARFSEDIPF